MEESLQRQLASLLRKDGARPVVTRRPRKTPVFPLPPGREVENAHGRYYLAEVDMGKLLALEECAALSLAAPPWTIDDGPRGPLSIDRPLFLDIETTGFRSTPLFLITTFLHDDTGEFRFRQRFARNYSEEAAVIAATLEELANARSLVTYNGKSYDLPFIRTRAAFHRIRSHFDGPHLDLLHTCRRRWKGEAPDFRLQTMEHYFAPLSRSKGDIPSFEIPALYHRYVRTGHDPRLRSVFRHNLRDVLTMIRLLEILLREEATPREESKLEG